MKRALVILGAFCIVVLILLGVQAIDCNRDELTHRFAFYLSLPLLGTFKTRIDFSVAEYFAFCVLGGALAVTLLSLGSIFRSSREAGRARRELADCRAELTRLRGPAEDDIVYRPASTAEHKD
jgi:hypothetical protein